ncbi:hypothetical protein N9140_01135, partial [bacterium]|nr:hypothetical protein [bacterium]
MNTINDFPSDLIEEARSILRATETSPVASVAASSVDVAASVPPSPRRGPAASLMWLGAYVSNTLLLSSSRAQNSSPVPSSSSRSDPSGTLHRSDAPQGHANVTTRRSGGQGSIPSRRPDPDGRTSPIAIANATTRRTSPPSSIHTHSSLGPDASSHHMGGTVHPYHHTSHHIHHNMGGVHPPPTRPYFHSYLGQNMGGTSSPYHHNNNNNIGQSMGGTTYPPHHNNNYYYSGSSHPLPSGYMHTSSHHNMGGDAPSTLDGMSSSGSSVYPPSVITQPSSTSGSSSDPPPSSVPSPAPAPAATVPAPVPAASVPAPAPAKVPAPTLKPSDLGISLIKDAASWEDALPALMARLRSPGYGTGRSDDLLLTDDSNRLASTWWES